jgi:hypothetical protein
MYFPIGSQLVRIHYGWAPKKPLELLLFFNQAPRRARGHVRGASSLPASASVLAGWLKK